MINLRELRKQKGLTMKQLGTELGMAESTVSLYETGKRNPDVQTLIRFADFFDVSLDSLCGRDFYTDGSMLSEKDQMMLQAMEQLNEEGQDKVMEYIDDLLSSTKYIKMHKTGMVGKA